MPNDQNEIRDVAQALAEHDGRLAWAGYVAKASVAISALDRARAALASPAPGESDNLSEFNRRINIRLNGFLCEMREGQDDSIVGFNDAWDVMNKLLVEMLCDSAALAVQPREGGGVLHDALRELVAKWVRDAESGALIRGPRMCADELERALSAAPLAPATTGGGVEAAAIRIAAERAIKLSRDGADDDGIAIKTFHAIATPETVLAALSAAPVPAKPADNLFDLVVALACAYTESDAYRSALEKINQQRYYDNPAAHEMALIADHALKTIQPLDAAPLAVLEEARAEKDGACFAAGIAIAERDEARWEGANLRKILSGNEGAEAVFNKYAEDIQAFADRAEQAEAECKRLVEALTPSADTKAAYIGEFSFQIEIEGEDEDGFPEPVVIKTIVPWTTTKEIMAAILARAAITGEKPNAD